MTNGTMLREILSDIRLRQPSKWVLPVLFWAFAMTVAAYWVFARPNSFLDNENRERAQWPSMIASEVFDGSWGAKAETWMSDHVPAREAFVGVYAYWRLLTGRQSAEDVYVDSAGNLLEAPAAMSEEELEKRLDRIWGFAESNGVHTVLAAAPTAGYMSKELISDMLWRGYHDDEIMEAAFQYAAGKPDASVFVADLRQAIENAVKQGDRAFYRTDHHWTMDGAYAAYLALADSLGYDPLPKESFAVEKIPGFYGSTYSRSGLWFTAPDELEIWRTADASWRVQFNDEDGATHSDVYFKENVAKKDKYLTYLDGNHPLVIIENLSASHDDKTLLIIKDSYADCLAPLLALHYSKVIMVDPRYYRRAASELIEVHGVDQALAVFSMEHIVNDRDLLLLR